MLAAPSIATAANIALEAPAGSSITQAGESFQDIRALLEERGHTVTIVSAANIDTLDEIQEYDAIVIGGSVFGDVDVTQYDDVIVDYVSGGGGIVFPGVLALVVDVGSTPGLDTVSPTDASFNVIEGGVEVELYDHEITEGLNDWVNPSFDILLGSLREGADGLSSADGQLDAAAWQYDGGRTVVLGPLFLSEYSGFGTTALLDGSIPDATEMFLRSIEWVAQGSYPEGCHDGILDPTEECDDGNFNNGDACVNPCVFASCGDHYVQVGVEQCDDGDDDNTDACLVGCISASCGDGFVRNNVEDCDDANDDETDDCISNCQAASCGDGFLHAGVETCDDGNLNNTDECPGSCHPAVCGDGYVLVGVEPCDDGNEENDDDCLVGCIAPTCGDGFLQNGTEACDDANDDNTDACIADGCQLASCGDGYVFAGFEECDDGNATPNDGCTACQLDGEEESSSGGEESSSGESSSGAGPSDGSSEGSATNASTSSGGDSGVTSADSSGGGESSSGTGDPSVDGDGGGCSCTTDSRSTSPWWLVVLGLARRRFARSPGRRGGIAAQ